MTLHFFLFIIFKIMCFMNELYHRRNFVDSILSLKSKICCLEMIIKYLNYRTSIWSSNKIIKAKIVFLEEEKTFYKWLTHVHMLSYLYILQIIIRSSAEYLHFTFRKDKINRCDTFSLFKKKIEDEIWDRLKRL